MLPKEGKWLVAVSSGPDSMALFTMCLKEGLEIGVAFVNYHQRKQAANEQQYIEALCKEKEIPLYIKDDPFTYTGNFEAEARKYRYRFFAEVVKEYGYQGVLLGHQQDDHIETYLMQKEKNLCPLTYGLQEEADLYGVHCLRPLLRYTKQELQDYCDNNGVRYFVDHTNAENQYTRNRIRNEVLSSYSKEDRDTILREIEEKNEELRENRGKARHLIQNNRVHIDEYRKQDEVIRSFVLRELLEEKEKHLSLDHIQAIDENILNHPDFVIEVDDKAIVQENGTFFVHQFLGAYAYQVESLDALYALKDPHFLVEEGRLGLYGVTIEASDYPLTVRSVKEGDEILMRYGTKKVHRFFVDRHIPLYLRKEWPVVENAKGDIILVPGLGCDCYHFSIKPTVSVIQYPNSEGGANDARKGY